MFQTPSQKAHLFFLDCALEDLQGDPVPTRAWDLPLLLLLLALLLLFGAMY